ncbi:hypothetical protein [Methanimicrococcus stummii]|uniref:hypothetical protein n=1 Tax=Methanimicrococcus stummii TaxID=3028294 RepID=UPI00292D5564|nr:hypothetical protein [Methanimicrococcus sp. Es2]
MESRSGPRAAAQTANGTTFAKRTAAMKKSRCTRKCTTGYTRNANHTPRRNANRHAETQTATQTQASPKQHKNNSRINYKITLTNKK